MNAFYDPSAAQAIYQRSLDETGAAVEARDYAAYAAHFSLPHTLKTAAGTSIIATDAQLSDIFHRICNTLALKNVEGLTRICTVAEFVDEETIRGSHQTWLISRNREIRETFAALGTMRLQDGRWRVCDSEYDGSGEILPLHLIKQPI